MYTFVSDCLIVVQKYYVIFVIPLERVYRNETDEQSSHCIQQSYLLENQQNIDRNTGAHQEDVNTQQEDTASGADRRVEGV